MPTEKMLTYRQKLLRRVLPLFLLVVLDELLFTGAHLKSIRLEEIPFEISQRDREPQRSGSNSDIGRQANHDLKNSRGIHAISQLEERHSGFFHIFNVPYIVCFFAAKGKWPYIPPFMQMRVDSVARTIFNQNDSYVRNFCKKWMQIKQCFRPNMGPTANPDVDGVSRLRQTTPCTCTNQKSEHSVVYFDKNYVGNASMDTILNTIEFLESFLPPPTRKTKKKNNRVRSRLDDMDIE